MIKRTILEDSQFNFVVKRLCCELIENHDDFSSSVILGLQPRGVYLADRIVNFLTKQFNIQPTYGTLDATFHRDDFRRKETPLIPNKTDINFRSYFANADVPVL